VFCSTWRFQALIVAADPGTVVELTTSRAHAAFAGAAPATLNVAAVPVIATAVPDVVEIRPVVECHSNPTRALTFDPDA
jgi:hypothetical protein